MLKIPKFIARHVCTTSLYKDDKIAALKES